MIDIHSHILPGIDDGVDSLDEALQMAEMAIEDGISLVVATPHANAQYSFHPELVRERRNELQSKLGERMRLATGCDFHLSIENIRALQASPSDYTINQKSYLLVEFADFAIPPHIAGTLHHILLMGISPVITHPERNVLIRTEPKRLHEWMRIGCYVQVTAQAFLGRFGQTAQRAVEVWMDEQRIHFVATDAHNLDSRPMRLRAAREAVAEGWGEDVAQALFHDNPLAAVEGKMLPYSPEPLETPAGRRGFHRRKRFFFF